MCIRDRYVPDDRQILNLMPDYYIYYILINNYIYKPYRALISSIRSIGFRAAMRSSSSIVISGSSYLRHVYNFSSVFNFIYGQSLQAQALLGGAGINVLPGLASVSYTHLDVYKRQVFNLSLSNPSDTNCSVIPVADFSPTLPPPNCFSPI